MTVVTENSVEGLAEGSGDMGVLFAKIAQNLTDTGYSIHTNALPLGLSQRLLEQLQDIPPAAYKHAGVGRGGDFQVDGLIRKDKISWIDESYDAGADWNAWVATLQTYLNARLYLGLSFFESHFSQYQEGEYYKRHQDAFVGQSNRILSIVTYFNRDWKSADAGELVLFLGGDAGTSITVPPAFGTFVVFMSEEIPHEVLPTTCDRFSVAGWCRASTGS